jgi:hypothetical protein
MNFMRNPEISGTVADAQSIGVFLFINVIPLGVAQTTPKDKT